MVRSARGAQLERPESKAVACLIHEDASGAHFLMFNAGPDAVDFGSPRTASGPVASGR